MEKAGRTYKASRGTLNKRERFLPSANKKRESKGGRVILGSLGAEVERHERVPRRGGREVGKCLLWLKRWRSAKPRRESKRVQEEKASLVGGGGGEGREPSGSEIGRELR